MEKSHDLVVLGGGPGGYVAAIRAAQLGMDVACIDENPRFGGTCLRVGCIPSKALLESSHRYADTLHSLADHGISVSEAKLDLAKMLARKDDVVEKLTGGIKMLLDRNKVTTYVGRGRFETPNRLMIATREAPVFINAKHVIIAVGSRPAMMNGVAYDGDRIGDSTTALSYAEVPKRLVVIGGGYIGLELGSVWSRLGSEVTVLEAMDRVLPGVDEEIGKVARRLFEKQGLKFVTGAWVESAVVEGDECVVKCRDRDPITADRVLLCTGRVPNTGEIGADAIGIQLDRRGAIQVDGRFQTGVPGVYAIGDCIGGAMLAHKASEEGIACVEMLATGHGSVHYDAIPAIVYTDPEIAMIGKTEQQLKEEGIEYRKGVCPYGANGRARSLGDVDGRVKILADAKTDRILGVHAIGMHAGDLIAECAVAMTFGASSEDLARCCHAHPTLSEIVMEAALAVNGRAIHT
ncbi:MAG: dihydrolipoyl dehydrogenase [Planctomycetales bacterium]|nr:dihydrolipoyl dehydrogenase [Planctomycetales bacterium]